MASDLWANWASRTARSGAHNNDPFYHYQMNVLVDMLQRLEVILEDQGVLSKREAHDVLQALIYGAPHVADAEYRQAQEEQLTKLIRSIGLPPRAVTTDYALKWAADDPSRFTG
jgi:hypothetical protein